MPAWHVLNDVVSRLDTFARLADGTETNADPVAFLRQDRSHEASPPWRRRPKQDGKIPSWTNRPGVLFWFGREGNVREAARYLSFDLENAIARASREFANTRNDNSADGSRYFPLSPCFASDRRKHAAS